ncbi:hypothetical protein TRIATDRAFT_287102 [Trichoderma atroviride IMI 206040]|uniref:3'-5' exonuclease domain-containing protein n=1 Tax=Hypocrea atroviridis (strain ATCC 20476 / IMI 206040) TaxID=452589 RepID=G9P7X1_HYPAI|nr:uncharacterized protein TRIATDRAFT_287102 [Trichoderma atroviride IMI 206040]EHK41658.1 hypothetical protein TRIATDRAFT_287102 [Trichoderma atroviride IMI 206040]
MPVSMYTPAYRVMSFNPPNQLWSSQFGVRFGALASPQDASNTTATATTAATTATTISPHSSFSVQSDESWSQTSVSSTQTGVFSAGAVEDPLPPASYSNDVAAFDAARRPISLPGLNVAADTVNSVATTSSSSTDTNKAVEPPFTPLEFNISREQFLAARAAAPGTPESHWSYAMYHRNGENGAVDNVKVHYCESKATMERVCTEYFLDQDVIGLDLEWMAYARTADGPRRNVSLIQIASPSRIALFHIAVFKYGADLVPPSFRKIMENPKVSKVGVNIGPDCTRLRNHLGVNVQGIFELSHLYRIVKHFPHERRLIHKTLVSLATQVQDQLLLPLYKGEVRTGNWMRRLNPQQIDYAASDAYAGLQLYYVLEEKRKMLVPCPPRPHHAELRLPISLPDTPEEAKKKDDEDAALIADPCKTNVISKPKYPKPRVRKPKVSSTEVTTTEIATTEVTSTEVTSTGAPATKAPTPSRARSRRSLPKPIPVDTRDARVIAAEAQMKEYRAAKTTELKTAVPCLRAYYMWHRNEDLCPGDIAALLRDPPLLTSTVAHYVLDAIKAENLPYPVLRLHKEVIPHVDLSRSYWSKHTSLVQECTKLADQMKADMEKANETHE